MSKKKSNFAHLRGELNKFKSQVIQLTRENKALKAHNLSLKDIQEDHKQSEKNLEESMAKISRENRAAMAIMKLIGLFEDAEEHEGSLGITPLEKAMNKLRDFLHNVGVMLPYIKCPNAPCGCGRELFARKILGILINSRDSSILEGLYKGVKPAGVDGGRVEVAEEDQGKCGGTGLRVRRKVERAEDKRSRVLLTGRFA